MLEAALFLLAMYSAFGMVFALAFVAVGVQRVDPLARNAHWGFRLVILPGVLLFWPLLLWRWSAGRTAPPVERTAHRL